MPGWLFWLGGSLVSALSFVASYTHWIGAWCSWRVSLFWFLLGPLMSWHTSCHHAWTEMILGYHLLQNYPFHTWTGTCHVTVLVVWGVFGFVCFGFVCFCVFVFCWFLVSWFLLFRFAFWWWLVTVNRTMYRSFTSSLLRPLYRRRPTHDIINQLIPICNMQWNMLNDLAEAMKALDGKKMLYTCKEHAIRLVWFFSRLSILYFTHLSLCVHRWHII